MQERQPVMLDVFRDQHAQNSELRRIGPVTEVVLPGGVRAWAVNRHRLLRDLLLDPRISRDSAHWRALREGRVPAGWPLLSVITVRSMATVDGEDHHRLRGLVSQAFTARRIEELRPAIVKAVQGLLDGLERAFAEKTAVDLRAYFAHPLSLTVICDLMGFPEARRDDLRRISDLLSSGISTTEEQIANEEELYRLLAEFIAESHELPTMNLTKALIDASTNDGDRLSDAELQGTLATLLVAGHGTTAHLIINATTALLANPHQLDRVLSGRSSWESVIEETLRWDSPLGQFPMRFATEDLTVGGASIRRGDAVLASYAAVGRDTDHHGEAAQAFDITRERSQHLSFGHGIHYCLGAPLARLEAEIALSQLFDRFPSLTAAVDLGRLRPLPSVISNSRRRLPVRITKPPTG